MMGLLGALLAALAGWAVGAGLNWLARRLQPQGASGEAGARPARGREIGLQVAAALCAAALWLRFGLVVGLAWAAASTALLLLVAAIDVDCRLVLNKLLLVGAALALARAATLGVAALPPALSGGALGLAIFLALALAQRGALGMGDVKLAGLLGLLLGYPLVLTALTVGVLIGGLTAGLLILTHRVDRRAAIPYAPFLSAGGIVALLLQS